MVGPGPSLDEAPQHAGEAADPAVPRRPPRRPGIGRIVALLLVILAVPVAVSYVSAMLRPSNSGIGVRSVEWLRDNGFAWLVNDVEHTYYSLTAPAKGGPGLKKLPGVGGAVVASARGRRVATIYHPPRLAAAIHPRLPGEGAWHTTGIDVGGQPAVLLTTYRPDPNYPRLVAGLAWIDHTRATLRLQPGRYEPTGSGPRGTSMVPVALRHRLLATFNSGFKLQDSHGGFYARGHLFSPLVRNRATLVGNRGGSFDVRNWAGGPAPPPGVVFARQNLPLIVDKGVLNPNLSDGPAWGATLGNAIRVWRSGVGVDRHGNLIYAAANDQTVGSLAAILRHAGAVRAMELDINSEWVSFISYAAPGAAGPSNLLAGMNRPATRYLTPDDRDFFSVYAKPKA